MEYEAILCNVFQTDRYSLNPWPQNCSFDVRTAAAEFSASSVIFIFEAKLNIFNQH